MKKCLECKKKFEDESKIKNRKFCSKKCKNNNYKKTEGYFIAMEKYKKRKMKERHKFPKWTCPKGHTQQLHFNPLKYPHKMIGVSCKICKK